MANEFVIKKGLIVDSLKNNNDEIISLDANGKFVASGETISGIRSELDALSGGGGGGSDAILLGQDNINVVEGPADTWTVTLNDSITGDHTFGNNLSILGDITLPNLSGNADSFMQLNSQGKLIAKSVQFYDPVIVSNVSAGSQILDTTTEDLIKWFVSISNGSNKRSSEILVSSDGISSVDYSENFNEIGDTADVTLSVDSSRNLVATVAGSGSWDFVVSSYVNSTLNLVNTISISAYDTSSLVADISGTLNDLYTRFNYVDSADAVLQSNIDAIDVASGTNVTVTESPADTWTVNLNSSIAGDHTFENNVTVSGNLYVNGTETIVNTTSVSAADNQIVINAGEAGAGVTAGLAGVRVDRGSLDPYDFQFRESDDTFVIGVSGSYQSVATREDAPLDGGYARWNNVEKRYDAVTTSTLVDDASGALDARYVEVAGDTMTGNLTLDGGNISTGGVAAQETLHVHTATNSQEGILITNNATGSTGTDGLFIGVAGTGGGTKSKVLSNETTDLDIGTNATPVISINASNGLTIKNNYDILADGTACDIGNSSIPFANTYSNFMWAYGSTPTLNLWDTDAPADERRWRILNNNGSLRIQAMNDAGGGGGNLIDIERTAQEVSALRIGDVGAPWSTTDSTGITLGNNRDLLADGTACDIGSTSIPFSSIYSTANFITSASPYLYFTETDAPSSHNRFNITLATEDVYFQTRKSDNTFISSDYIIVRDSSGATQHQWRIGNSSQLFVNSGNVTVSSSVHILATNSSSDIGSTSIPFRAVYGSNLYARSSSPSIRLQETDAPSTHSDTWMSRDGSSLSFQVRDSSGVFVTNAYQFNIDSAGANNHIWRIGTTTKMDLDTNNLALADGVDLIAGGSSCEIGSSTTPFSRLYSNIIDAYGVIGSIRLRKTDAGVDNKQWDINLGPTNMAFRLLNDSFTSATTWMDVNRQDGNYSMDFVRWIRGGTELVRMGAGGLIIQNSLDILAGASLSNIGSSSVPFANVYSNFITLPAPNTETRAIEIGKDRAGNGTSHIDLIGDATYTDFGFRIIRGNTGPNTASDIINRGSGLFRFYAGSTGSESGSFNWNTAGSTRMTLDSTALTLSSGIDLDASGGRVEAGIMNIGARESVTIAAGVATITKSNVVLTGQGNTTDDLNTITLSGVQDGDIIRLRSSTSSYTITAKDAIGNLQLSGDFAFTNARDSLLLIYDSTGGIASWLELSRSSNG